MIQASPVSLSANSRINALLGTDRWALTGQSGVGAPVELTYSFINTGSRFTANYSSAREYLAIEEFSALQKDLVRASLREIEAVANLRFTEVADSRAIAGVVRFGMSSRVQDAGGWAYPPGGEERAGDVWINPSQGQYIGQSGAFYFQHLVLHETLHALGLKHPFEASAPFYETLSRELDIVPLTVMSYSEFAGVSNVALTKYPVRPMYLDIAALQWIYGSASLNATDTQYDLSSAEQFGTFVSLWDSGGQDTLDGSRVQSSLVVSLVPGDRNNIGQRIAADNGQAHVQTMIIANDVAIERLIGSSFGDTLTGSAGNDYIDGGNGNDSLSGGAGNDTLLGGAGADTITGGFGQDIVQFGATLASHMIRPTTWGFDVAERGGQTDSVSEAERLVFSDGSINLSIQVAANTLSSLSLKRLQELYVAFFNRIPEADGLEFWITRFQSGQSLRSIADTFYEAGVEYAQLTGYSRGMGNDEFVRVIYRNVLGRSDGGDAEGTAFWANRILRGEDSRGSVVSTILDSAHTFKGSPAFGYVADLLDNKALVSQQLAVRAGLNFATPEESITRGMSIARAITPTDTSVALALVGVELRALEFIA